MRLNGRFGRFGGCYVPEILVPALEQLEAAFLDAQDDPAFAAELNDLLANYAGRPTPLTRCRNLPGNIYLKREDLLHGGAHKTNQVLGQGLLAKRMGKTRLIAETGAGQHGVATAIVGALLGFETVIYMGAEDVERQQLNVFRMQLMGAEVVPVESGGRTLKDAINEALRDWSASFETTHYLLGTAAGPHPFPTMVREFQRVIGREARAQMLEQLGRLARRGRRLRRRRLERDRPVRRFHRRRRAADRGRGGRQGAGRRGAWRDPAARPARHPARRRDLRAAGRGRADRRHLVGLRRASIIRRSVPSMRISRTAAGPNMSARPTPRRSTRSRRWRESEGIICAFESAHALAHALKLAEAGAGQRRSSSACPVAATRTSRRRRAAGSA